jgi:outer membrane lipoprotein-sorting protein
MWFACVLAAPVAGAARAAEAPEWGIAQLMQALAAVKESRSRFVERKHLGILKEPLVSSGTLAYRAPGHLEKQTLSPRRDSLVLDGERLTLEDGESQRRRTVELQSYPAIWAFVEGIRATLAGDLGALSRFYRVELRGERSRWRLVLAPTDPAMLEMVSEIRIDGGGDRIRAIEIVEPSGDRSVMTITRDAP